MQNTNRFTSRTLIITVQMLMPFDDNKVGKQSWKFGSCVYLCRFCNVITIVFDAIPPHNKRQQTTHNTHE